MLMQLGASWLRQRHGVILQDPSGTADESRIYRSKTATRRRSCAMTRFSKRLSSQNFDGSTQVKGGVDSAPARR